MVDVIVPALIAYLCVSVIIALIVGAMIKGRK